MSASHEQQCERTIASVVHEIDDLEHQLADARATVSRVATELASFERDWIPNRPNTVVAYALARDIRKALETS